MKRARRAASAARWGGAAAVAAAGGASWYYARRIVEPPADARPEPPEAADRVTVEAADSDRVTLRGPDAGRRGVWGLAWNGGYAQVADPVEVDGDRAVRPARGLPALPAPGTPALLDPFAYPPDPGTLGLDWHAVSYRSPVGDLPAWEFPAAGRTWAIFVHGRSTARHEALRLVPTTVGLGLPSLAITYRNDPDAPRSPDGRSHLGATEWEDVESAVVYALSRGAEDVVLFGFSMGGACVVQFLRTSSHAERVRGVVLEAPVLDWAPVLRRAAVQRGLPEAVVPVLLPATMAVARLDSGIDWRALRQLARPRDLRHPILLVHGDADPTVPVELADGLAAARPDLITYLRVPGAGHGRSWNADPGTYERAVTDFLSRVLEGPATSRRRRRRRG